MPHPEFKLIVAGGRDFTDFNRLSNKLNELDDGVFQLRDVSIVTGMARGADALGQHFATMNHIKLYKFPADWNGPHGKGAGFARNRDMAHFSDGLLAFWDGKSRGTAHMIDYMKSLSKPVHIVSY